jgi:hypothetical protein
VAALALLFGGAVVVSADALPGDTLYGVKRTVEDTRIALTFDPASRAMAHLRLAEIRLSEIRELIDRGISVPASVIEDFLQAQSAALQEAAAASDSLAAVVEGRVAEHSAALKRLIGSAGAGDPATSAERTSPPTRDSAGGESATSAEAPASSERPAGGETGGDRAPAETAIVESDPASPTPTRTPTSYRTATARPESTAPPVTDPPPPPTVVAGVPTSTQEPPSGATPVDRDQRDRRATEWAQMTQTAESGSAPNVETPLPTMGATQEPTPEPDP